MKRRSSSSRGSQSLAVSSLFIDSLIGIDVRQKVAMTDYTEIETIVKQSWLSISSSKFIVH